MTPQVGQTITLITVAPISARHIGRTGVVQGILGNSILIKFTEGDSALVHRGWGTRKNPGNLEYKTV